jgi:transketolase C-terminal domain/subunit
VVTVEEHLRTGGLNGAVLEALSEGERQPMPRVTHVSIRDVFTHHYGSQADLLEHYGLTADNIAATILGALSKGD